MAGLAMAVWEQSVACRLFRLSGAAAAAAADDYDDEHEHGAGPLSLNLARNAWSDPSILRMFHRAAMVDDNDIAFVSTRRRPFLQQLWQDTEDCWQGHPEHRDWVDQMVAAMAPCLQTTSSTTRPAAVMDNTIPLPAVPARMVADNEQKRPTR